MKRCVLGLLVACAVVASTLASFAASASASTSTSAPTARVSYPGMQHLHFAAGPYKIRPGANLILLDYNHVPKPNQDGYLVRMAPNLSYARPSGTCCGKVPPVDVIHLHHGVWVSNGVAGEGEGNSYVNSFYPFMASGEEKTVYEMPKGYGYPVGANDRWVLNYMIHDLTKRPAEVYITYAIDFVPATSPAAARITPVHPIWMDVEAHHLYPVYDIRQHSGVNGKFTFPDMARNPYGGAAPLNQFTLDHSGVLVGTAGHLHPGGLYDDLNLVRPGAHASGGAIRGSVPHSVRLFRSHAHYWDNRGPISWNLAMTATAPNWRPQVKAGEVLRISSTYDTTRASWHEVMGIMVVWEAWDKGGGVDPFSHSLVQADHVTHGYLVENNDNGGSFSLSTNPTTFPTCRTHQVKISGFQYSPGGFDETGARRCAPTIRQGQSLTFVNDDASPLSAGSPLFPSPAYLASVFHTVTACRNPCNLNPGISYPLANGAGGFDSGQLGLGTPAVDRVNWSTPANLRPGSYTFFCRIHPFMRGVFTIIH